MRKVRQLRQLSAKCLKNLKSLMQKINRVKCDPEGEKIKLKKGTGLDMNTKIKIEERVQRLVMVMGKGAHPRRELMAALGLRQESRRNFYDNYMKPARARGLVTMQCPGHPSIPEQTYRLTADGLEYLEGLSKKEQAIQGS